VHMARLVATLCSFLKKRTKKLLQLKGVRR